MLGEGNRRILQEGRVEREHRLPVMQAGMKGGWVGNVEVCIGWKGLKRSC